nr:NAD-dependent malic enzyme [Nitrospiraceae bacterium]
MHHRPSPGYSITIRCEIENRVGMFARIAAAIGKSGGDLGSIDIVRVEKGKIIRDITVNARDEEHERQIVRAVKAIPGLKALRVLDKTFFVHQGGKIEIHNRIPVRNRDDLSKVYTPGVARVCLDIKENREHAWRYTIKGNTILIITDGTAVLGLGDIGPEAAMPVMEGKAMLFKEFGGVDAFPMALGTTDPDAIVSAVEKIAPAFGGINLEDISAPRCFDIESRLRRLLDIPVFHDDQHGTAVIITAALMNVSRLLKKDMKKMRVAVAGAGAAGMATSKMLLSCGIRDITVCDRAGAIYAGRRRNMNPYKKELARLTNPRNIKGSLADAMRGAEIFIGLSGPGAVRAEDVKGMA